MIFSNPRKTLGFVTWIYLCGSCFLHCCQGYPCHIGSTTTLQLDVEDDGHVESANYPNQYPAIKSSCQVNFYACAGCVLELTLVEFSLPPCVTDLLSESHSKSCDDNDLCEYFIVEDNAKADNPIVLSQLNKTTHVLRLESTSVTLKFCYSSARAESLTDDDDSLLKWKIAFSVQDSYTHRYIGSATEAGMPTSGVITSSGFPFSYTRTRSPITYLIQGTSSNDCIMLVFDDFDIDDQGGEVRLYDGGERQTAITTDVYTGQTHTYPSMISSSHYLLVEFIRGSIDYSSRHTGFKASFEIVQCSVTQHMSMHRDHCGSVLPKYGGFINVHGRTTLDVHRVYDCVWSLPVVNPSWMYVSVLVFNISPDSKESVLKILDSPLSTGQEITRLSNQHNLSGHRHSTSDKMDYLEAVSERGLYIRFKGRMSRGDSISIAYAPFQKPEFRVNSGCNLTGPSPDQHHAGFLCLSSNRCIPRNLICDGVNHCGDMTDENTEECKVQSDGACLSAGFRNCNDGHCVRSSSPCLSPTAVSAQNCDSTTFIPCKTTPRCYPTTQQCDGVDVCGDNSDEQGCFSLLDLHDADQNISSMRDTIKHTWYIFLPVIVLQIVACGTAVYVIYRRKRNKRPYKRVSGTACSSSIQLETLELDNAEEDFEEDNSMAGRRVVYEDIGIGRTNYTEENSTDALQENQDGISQDEIIEVDTSENTEQADDVLSNGSAVQSKAQNPEDLENSDGHATIASSSPTVKEELQPLVPV